MCYYVQIGDVLIGTPNPPQRFSELLNNGGVYDFGRFPAGTIPLPKMGIFTMRFGNYKTDSITYPFIASSSTC